MTADIEKLKALARDLVDEEGENRAVRTFLMQWGLPGLTVGAMAKHMQRSGWDETHIPQFARSPVVDGMHLTKAGAQIWLRHLFSLEGGNTSTDVSVINYGNPVDNCTVPAAGTEKDAELVESGINKIREAIADYYRALNARHHGHLAMDRAFRSIERELGMSWDMWTRAEQAAIEASNQAKEPQ